jgi:hypothetical protein
MDLVIYYNVMQVDLDDETDEIVVKKIRIFEDSERKAEEFMELCKQLKPEAKFYIEEEY